MLEIRAPRIFAHAGRLPPRFASRDPREPDFAEDVVRIDLRGCEFVYPPAVLWCAVYAALVRRLGIACELLVPENLGVASYLMTVGLYSTLADIDVAVDQRGIGMGDESQIILPLKRFDSLSSAEDLCEMEVVDALQSRPDVSGSLTKLLSYAFGELANNAAEHAESPIDAFAVLQFYKAARKPRRFACVVADGGLGIRKTLLRNPDLDLPAHYDWVAIDYATRERWSGTASPWKGMGLHGVADSMRKPGCGLIIHSGIGAVFINDRSESHVTRSKALFPGTLASAEISF